MTVDRRARCGALEGRMLEPSFEKRKGKAMKKIMRLVAGLFLLLNFTILATAQRDRWDYLGEANVDGGADHDRIEVGEGRGAFRAIKLGVERGPIEFDRVIVHYGNGAAVPIAISRRIPAGGQTRVIDLPGERRFIRDVEFYYRKGNWRSSKPKVRLYGIRY
jgi:hypothetical protein